MLFKKSKPAGHTDAKRHARKYATLRRCHPRRTHLVNTTPDPSPSSRTQAHSTLHTAAHAAFLDLATSMQRRQPCGISVFTMPTPPSRPGSARLAGSLRRHLPPLRLRPRVPVGAHAMTMTTKLGRIHCTSIVTGLSIFSLCSISRLADQPSTSHRCLPTSSYTWRRHSTNSSSEQRRCAS